MFDDPFVFFALVIAIVALIFARKAMNQVAELRQRLEAIQAAPAAAAAAVPPPLTPFEAFERTLPPASTEAASTPPPIIPESIAPAASSETSEQAAQHRAHTGAKQAGLDRIAHHEQSAERQRQPADPHHPAGADRFLEATIGLWQRRRRCRCVTHGLL